MKNKLLGSSPTLEQLTESIGKYFYSDNISVKEMEDGTYQVSNKNGVLKDYVIKEKKGRYRFEEVK